MVGCKLVAPIEAVDALELRERAQEARRQGADLVELRLDRCAAEGARLDDLLPLIPRLGLPLIATNRHVSEGGAWPGSEQERLDWILRADAAGADMIDIEFARMADLPLGQRRGRLILSHHDFEGMGEGDPEDRVAAMFAAGADIAKIALTPQDAADLAVIERLATECEPGHLVAIGMGEVGLPSRLLAGAWGMPFTFGRLDDSGGTAPGQPALRELRRLYRIHEQGPDTRIFGVLGKPVGHSLSPLIHNTAFQHIEADAVYVPFLADDAAAFWKACESWIDGLSITIPHKTALIDLVDEVEDLARDIGAINTIYRNDAGRSIGANTDADAALHCVRQHTGNLDGARVLILGAGGVARAIAWALHRAGARVTIANRTARRAEELARDIGCAAIALDKAQELDYRVLVNCTSVGMNSDESIWPKDAHKPGSCVFDTVYTPLETALLRDAQTNGCQPICGLSMFSLQAVGQFERWTGQPAPAHRMHRKALEALGHDPDEVCADPLHSDVYRRSDFHKR